MKTLVIHPDDPSTDFLAHIYEYIEDCDVYTYIEMNEYDTLDLIPYYDRIICLGHGCGDGLFGSFGFAISDWHVSELRNKELICIWCNADYFMKKHQLNGFYSGMFISEPGEAVAHNVKCRKKDIEDSNIFFAKLLGKYIDDPDRLNKIKEKYKGNSVAKFNNDRLYDTSILKGE